MKYRDSGVDIDAGNELAMRIKPIAARTHGDGVIGGVGGFGALFALPAGYQNPVLVSATDGVGSKLKLASQLGRDDGVGIDLVAMCVNDIVVAGAAPMFFLDYFATGKLDIARAETIVAGVARGCTIAGCALVGGESAEMPGMYQRGDYDLAGFAVGVVERDDIIAASRVRVGDVALGLASSGAHANGYSLIRKVLEVSGDDLNRRVGDATLADVLLAPTRIYAKSLLRLFAQVKVSALAHITGGGLIDNPPRSLPDGVVAAIHRDRWSPPPVFEWLRAAGVDDDEMLRTFNCGVGMLVVVRAADAERAAGVLTDAGETVFVIGDIRAAADTDAPATVLIK